MSTASTTTTTTTTATNYPAQTQHVAAPDNTYDAPQQHLLSAGDYPAATASGGQQGVYSNADKRLPPLHMNGNAPIYQSHPQQQAPPQMLVHGAPQPMYTTNNANQMIPLPYNSVSQQQHAQMAHLSNSANNNAQFMSGESASISFGAPTENRTISPSSIGVVGKGPANEDPLSQHYNFQNSQKSLSANGAGGNDAIPTQLMQSFSLLSNQPFPDVALSTNLQRGVHSNSQWTLASLLQLKEEFLELYQTTKAKQKQWKLDVRTLESCDKASFTKMKRRKLNNSAAQSSATNQPATWKFVNQVKRCGFVNARGMRCKRAGVCPFHGEGAELIQKVMRRKYDRDLDLLILAASTLEKNELKTRAMETLPNNNAATTTQQNSST
mmetsp:Transcript_2716/g.10429  ORF Transcript_2716/g.10429 Transcript_2716/m.10429 type:complete len:382 (-) Transcript_2716:180-1325(-)